MHRTLGAGLAVVLGSSSALAEPGQGALLGTDPGTGALLSLDLSTGASTEIGPIGLGSSIPSLAVDAATGRIYLGEGGGDPVVHTLDPITGAATVVGDTGLGLAAIGGMDFDGAGTLYAAVNIAGNGNTGSDHLARIDPSTGVATVIGPFGSCTGVALPSVGTGSCTIEGMEGIAFDTDGTLWGSLTARGAAGLPGLYRIDVATGAATFATPILDGGGSSPSGGVTALQFACNGALYGGTARAIGELDDGGRLITIDPETGFFEFVGEVAATAGASLASLAFGRSCAGSVSLPSISRPVATLGSNCEFGASASGLGDIDSDGAGDYIVGGPGCGLEDGATVLPETGAAAVYLGVAGADQEVPTEPSIIFLGELGGDRAGQDVAGDCDVNGDGTPDILIGAPGANSGAGRTYVVYYDPAEYDLSSPPLQVELGDVGVTISGAVYEGEAPGDRSGFTVACGCAANTDPGEDFIIGAPLADAGKAYLIFGDVSLRGTMGLGQVACSLIETGCGADPEIDGVVLRGDHTGDRFGWDCACPGDVVEPVGDDVACGAPGWDRPESLVLQPIQDTGNTFVLSGGSLNKGIIDVCNIGVDLSIDGSVDGVQIRGEQAGEQLGTMVAGAGDNLADGEEEIVVGAPFYDDETIPVHQGGLDIGRIGQPSGQLPKGIIDVGGLVTPAASGSDGRIIVGSEDEGRFGLSASSLGDVTGNGFNDLAVGAPFSDPGGVTDAGIVYLVEGDSLALDVIVVPIEYFADRIGVDFPGRRVIGTVVNATSGASIAAAGDTNDDGKLDWLVGSSGLGGGDGGASLVTESTELGGTAGNGTPVADAGAPQVAECIALEATATLDGSGSSDPESDPLIYEWFNDFGQSSQTFLGTGVMLRARLPLGVNTVTLRVTDTGGLSDTDDVTLTVEDTGEPTLTVGATPGILWPPNHRMVHVVFDVTATDLCEGDVGSRVTLVDVVSSEPDDLRGGGDGATAGDVRQGTSVFEYYLRSERQGSGQGRTYTATYAVTDGSGRSDTASAEVHVPTRH